MTTWFWGVVWFIKPSKVTSPNIVRELNPEPVWFELSLLAVLDKTSPCRDDKVLLKLVILLPKALNWLLI